MSQAHLDGKYLNFNQTLEKISFAIVTAFKTATSPSVMRNKTVLTYFVVNSWKPPQYPWLCTQREPKGVSTVHRYVERGGEQCGHGTSIRPKFAGNSVKWRTFHTSNSMSARAVQQSAARAQLLLTCGNCLPVQVLITYIHGLWERNTELHG